MTPIPTNIMLIMAAASTIIMFIVLPGWWRAFALVVLAAMVALGLWMDTWVTTADYARAAAMRDGLTGIDGASTAQYASFLWTAYGPIFCMAMYYRYRYRLLKGLDSFGLFPVYFIYTFWHWLCVYGVWDVIVDGQI